MAAQVLLKLFQNPNMAKTFLKEANMDIIRYSNCWEDADILLEALSPTKGSNILSIASAGDNVFALLKSSPNRLVAVDLSHAQLALTELKKCAIQNFEHEIFLKFIGVKEEKSRINLYQKISKELSPGTRAFWDLHQTEIEHGIMYCGKFEKYFKLFRSYILPLIHTQKAVGTLLSEKSQTEQEIFYSKKWNTKRWRLLFRIFFSKFVMGKFGRDPEFLKQVDIPVGSFIFNQAENHLKDSHCQQNYFLNLIMRGKFESQLPFYMRNENYDSIRANLNSLELKFGYAQDACSNGSCFDYMNLSNIFEYMPEPVFEQTANLLQNGINNGGKIAYWNLMVKRKISEYLPEKFTYLSESKHYHKKDYGFFYRDFICEQKK